VLSEFSAHSGLSIPFLDAGSRVERRHIVEALRREIIGQDAALAAMADVVAVAKARLNDPGRPLGTLLFLGPTGVGKTAAAKALARYLYGDESRLLRFDMNEYVDSAALARLTGTFARPDGALTSAVRRQPYCVLLLDELEKAHPAVFDLLLSVLGEGRLTDSLGRTSDFTSAVIVMTSNLGTRQAASEFGLRPAAAASKDQVFIHAAREFFRPEFFNRIDRIVPFDPLGPEQVAAIADRLIAELFRREGLVHRRCVLDVHPAAMGRIVEGGYHPQLGARALKREIERQLTAPIAASLAQLTPLAPTVVSIVPSGEGVAPRVQALANVRPADDGALRQDADDVDAALDRVEDFLNQVESENQEQEPAGGAGVSSDALSPEHFRYFAVREQIQRIDRLIRQIDQSAEKAPDRNRRTPRLKPPRRLRWLEAGAPREGDLHARLAELWEAARPLGDAAPDRVIELLHEAALLRAISSAGVSRVLVGVRTVGGQDAANLKSLIDAYAHLFSRQYGFAATRLDVISEGWRWLVLEMPGIGSVLSGEAGTHLIYPAHENVLPVQLVVVELQTGEDALAVAARCAAEIKTWLSEVTDGRASPDADPFPLGPVIRIYDPSLATLDLRSGLLCPGLPRGDDLRRMIVAGLPPPPGGLRS
jgi:ATP-dependent Clp protease ATP-binding subunit ClpC